MARKYGTRTSRTLADISLMSHGLRSAAIVIPGLEEEQDWRDFHDDFVAALMPVGPIEMTLAARAAELAWRRRRIAPAEARMIAQQRHFEERRAESDRVFRNQMRAELSAIPGLGDFADEQPDTQAVAVAPARFQLEGDQLMAFLRYEAHLDRRYYQAMHELEALQERRNGRSAPLARVALYGSEKT